MASAFDKQQTPETIRENAARMVDTFWNDDPTAYDKAKARDRIEKARLCKIRQINAWRRKAGKHT